MDNNELIEAEIFCARALEKAEAALTHLKSAKSWALSTYGAAGF